MRNLMLMSVLMFIVISCKKDCEIKIEDTNFFYKNYFDVYHCATLEPWEYIYYSYDDFLEQENCSWNVPIVVPLDFNGIIISKGINLNYYINKNEVEILKNDCDKKIYYKYKTIIEDTLFANNSMETVITVIDSIPSDYKIEISYEVITFQE